MRALSYIPTIGNEMITLNADQALDMLEQAVAERGPDFVYKDYCLEAYGIRS